MAPDCAIRQLCRPPNLFPLPGAAGHKHQEMGLLPTPNHQVLIRDCYPVKSYGSTPLGEVKPDSNSLGKLCFYASGRPAKLPKVTAAIHARVQADAKGGSSPKSKAALAVSIDVMRSLVTECCRDLQCFADQALSIIDIAQTYKAAQDPEIEARTANLVSLPSPLWSENVL